MFKITGLDKITKELDQLQRVIGGLDGEIGQVKFDPSDPASIESAISDVENMIDQKAGHYASNSMAASIIEQMKDTYRQAILDKAAEARAAGDNA
ncbi:hypothetical protein QA648_36935 (plasmid) [Rhizobium sp. CB3171]|uniref:hypothetical protein n=1 Tax=Rhizobium sp. CB3171 TaxID=3039157 RepID=UPI0024B12144|nr:hypothetical protein [Rhizobium sp. CB3171]WFU07525.1 hypothetical protein QA648_36935 [Rhizobium sp. CB3171]